MQFFNPIIIVLSISAAACLVMLFAVLKNQASGRGISKGTGRILVALIITSLGWDVVQLLLHLQESNLIYGFDTYALQRIHLYAVLVNGVVFFHLTLRFQQFERAALPWWIGGAVTLLLTLLLYENPFYLPDFIPTGNGMGFVRWLVAFGVMITGWGVFMAGMVVLAFRSNRQKVSPLHRNRNHYWSTAVVLLILGQGACLARWFFVGNLLYLLAIILSVYVLTTYNLPDLRMGGKRAASYAIMTVITVLVYTAGFYVMQTYLSQVPGYTPLLAGGILAFALATLFNPLLNVVQRFVSRLIAGSRYDASQMLSEYSLSISNILELDVLATIVVGLISEAMEITHGALVTVSHENNNNPLDETTGGSFVLRSVSGYGKELQEGRLSAKNPAAYYLRREHQPLTQYDIDLLPRFQMMEPAERAWLNSLNMDVFVPIYAKENWIGVLALGPKASGDRYFDEDLVLLQTLADQTAVALENARLYEDLKERNAENERLNTDLKKANADLARLDQAKSDFINIASHELRTPLTQVIGYNDILSEMIKAGQLQPAMGKQMTESVRKAARRLEEIVETMFDVSKLDTRTLDLMRAPVSLPAVITVAIDTWQRGLEERGQTISVRGINTLPTIVADGKRLTQVFSHLIQNAIKSTPDGGQIRIIGRVVEQEAAPWREAINAVSAANPETDARVPNTAGSSQTMAEALLADLSAAQAEDGEIAEPADPANLEMLGLLDPSGSNGAAAGDNGTLVSGPLFSSPTPLASSPTPAKERFVEIIVADTGIGIAQDELERIFDKFYRVGNVLLHSTGETKFKGAGPGLGLTIARGIVEAHGGRIWAESTGHDEETCPGAKFHVLLPVKNLN